MINIKPGCKIKGIKPEILLGIMICYFVFEKHKIEFIITECTGSVHAQNSLHYGGLAADIRSKHIPVDKVKYQLLQDCAYALGNDFDFILEKLHEDGEHFHLEYDPQ